jgi:hypothetical protein
MITALIKTELIAIRVNSHGSNRRRKMSKRSCINCKYLIDGIYCKARSERVASSTLFKRGCQHFEESKQTVFEKITESVEALSPCFVEKQPDKWDDDDYPYYSYLTKEWYATEDKALAATIKELKKEYKNETQSDNNN